MFTRFICSMMMHLQVEKDIRNGLAMMKYAVNHYQRFTNVYPAFTVAVIHTCTSLLIEFSVVLVLLSLNNVLGIIMKYVSLSAIAKIPSFYYNSLYDNKLLSIAGHHKLQIDVLRRHDQLKNSPCTIKIMRFIQKSLRIIFCSWSYYFMPFSAMFMTYLVESNVMHA